MSMSHSAITTLRREEATTAIVENTELTEWARTALLIELRKPRRAEVQSLRTLAASRILAATEEGNA
jgi:hypothetical protein